MLFSDYMKPFNQDGDLDSLFFSGVFWDGLLKVSSAEDVL